MANRTVHAEHPAGEEIVRYDRAGKWYIELVEPSPDAPWRRQVSVWDAVQRARELTKDGFGTIHIGLPGGGMFDRMVS